MNRLICFVIAVSAGLVPCSRAAISVTAAGAGPLGFETTPNAAEFSTGMLLGGNSAFSTPEQLDAAVATLAASNVVLTLTTTATLPPSVFYGGFRHNIAGLFLQSRPGSGFTNAACLLLATLQNDSDAPLSFFVLSYDFNLYSPETLELPGFRVYCSSTGTPGNWQVVPELSGTETIGLMYATIAPATPWEPGQRFYLLWVDDNAVGLTDPAYTIDNFAILPVDAIPRIASHPQSREVTVGANVVFSVTAIGVPPLSYQWRRNGSELFGRTNASLSISNAQVADSGAYDVTVANGFGAVTSQVAMLSVGYRLTTTATGGGAVQVQPPGGVFAPGETVRLIAIPNTDREFRFWSGDVNTNANPLSLTMTSNTAVTANFGPFTALLELAVEGTGIIAPSPNKARYDVGEEVVLSANQAVWWYAFSHWTDGNTNNSRTITIGLTNRYTAVFVPTTALETVTYGGRSRTAPVGMPAVLLDGEFADDNFYLKAGSAHIEIFTTFPNGSIYYTLDGSQPTISSTYYQSSFDVLHDAPIWPVAYNSNRVNSVESYLINLLIDPYVFIHARRAGGGIVLSWPDYATGFTVESTSALGPTADWAPVGGTVVVTNYLNTLTIATTGDSRFFRLRKP